MSYPLTEENIEKIVKQKIFRGEVYYLVQWSPKISRFSQDWIPSSKFNSPKLLNKYYLQQKSDSKSSNCPYNILGCSYDNSKLILSVINTKTGIQQDIPAEQFRKDYPDELISFYEKHAIFL